MNDQESFLDRLTRWFTHDVKVCIENDAFIGAMTLMLCHISAFASYYSGRVVDRPQNDEKEFLDFYQKYFTVFPVITQPQIDNRTGRIKEVSLIYNHFRCGLIHEGLMKKGTALDRGIEKPNFYIHINSRDIVLNVDHFYEDYKKVIQKYKNDVRNDDPRGIKQNFINRAKFLGAEEPFI